MENVSAKSLGLITKIINFSKEKDFYGSIVKMLSDSFVDCNFSIYFLENTKHVLKAKTSKKFIYKETYSIDLKIKESVFGALEVNSKNKLTKEEKEAFNTLSSIISYKIKDYELNEVFKIQLKAMQDAVIEKDEAVKIAKKQHKKLQELDKQKSLFLANISHELRTPLNAIIGLSQALDSKIFGKLNDKQAEYIKDIQISSLHLLGMINEILDISKLEAHATRFMPINLDVHQTIQEALNIIEPLYNNKKITLKFNSKFNGTIKADYQKFQCILYNLLSNAIKFTPQNGKIEVNSYSKGKDYILEIKDNGIGIDKKYHNKIFKKFVQLDNIYVKNESSTGLGLAITKEFVKLHKGTITLESKPKKGSTFKIEFKNIIN